MNLIEISRKIQINRDTEKNVAKIRKELEVKMEDSFAEFIEEANKKLKYLKIEKYIEGTCFCIINKFAESARYSEEYFVLSPNREYNQYSISTENKEIISMIDETFADSISCSDHNFLTYKRDPDYELFFYFDIDECIEENLIDFLSKFEERLLKERPMINNVTSALQAFRKIFEYDKKIEIYYNPITECESPCIIMRTEYEDDLVFVEGKRGIFKFRKIILDLNENHDHEYFVNFIDKYGLKNLL